MLTWVHATINPSWSWRFSATWQIAHTFFELSLAIFPVRLALPWKCSHYWGYLWYINARFFPLVFFWQNLIAPFQTDTVSWSYQPLTFEAIQTYQSHGRLLVSSNHLTQLQTFFVDFSVRKFGCCELNPLLKANRWCVQRFERTLFR